MRKSTATVAATVLLGLSASGAQAVDPQMIGSDTLGPIMDALIGDSVNPNAGFGFVGTGSPTYGNQFPGSMVPYSYQGSGNGEDAIDALDQDWAPMSRFLSTSGTKGCLHTNADRAQAGCWQIARDAITLFGNTSQACQVDASNNKFSTLAYGQSMTVGDGNGDGTVSCPECTSGSYVFHDWRQVLRIIYAGEAGDPSVAMTTPSANIATRCNTDVRHTLIDNWSNLFHGGCATGACTGGLKHAFRRDDVSGTTAVVLQFLNLPPISATPFCNGTETDDQDPVRRACAGNGAESTANGGISGGTGGETVCGAGPTPSTRNSDGTVGAKSLGVVLPILLPPKPASASSTWSAYGGDTTLATKYCSAQQSLGSGGGAFGRVAWTLTDVQRYGSKCPNGAATVLGTCFWPKQPGTTGNQGDPGVYGFGCIASQNSRPTGSPSTFDARVYNLWARNADGSIKQYVRNTTQMKNQITSFFRYRQKQCREEGETGSQACLVAQDPCVMGYGGLSGVADFSVLGLGLERKDDSANDSFPTFTDAVQNDFYPLARPLYFCEIRKGTGAGHDSQSAAFAGAQKLVRDTIYNGDPNGTVSAAATAGGYFAVSSYQKTCCFGTYNHASDSCQ